MENRVKNNIFQPAIVAVPSGDGLISDNLTQISAHLVTSKPFLREAAYVFPQQPLENLVVINTMQHARLDLVRIGDDVEAEKDRLILSFFDMARYIRDELANKRSYWVDYIDPCSGLPVCSEGQNMFNEVDCAQTLLGYSVQNAGCCKIILHPQWGSAVYPASIFTTAPVDAVLAALNKLPRPGTMTEEEVAPIEINKQN
mmetsp:Transcript_71081/g.139622  ORF Transcript_71081/g.139622 Transcript_71081/m.139622 type:complete len:200 (+) Transcript_71081:17-616(+)|eukprot:CAMPEP_0170384440 /NCGR_PEP_ID=MMETSP0117_2-20130122/15999_1 /TAXON_ID=400756 /ORGANISM="Durinskia baltica, Strain CSIRO CS-38" /LENGTH=199 /DNA_ID=CAMNT_0010640189 /DNA_START=16 /DNA_END=615 /DNA_ORIENTATION=-